MPNDDNDVTRTSGPASGSGQEGWLSSSGAIDHGRFSPGAVLDGRYRIVGLLGRGGMGEVYRADDLRLGQAVAIKFLPDGLGADTRRLAQFHNEVRMARQVSHPNVCRVHDIGEFNAQLYLSMEFVDGEDLAASLKRVGRFPEEKALDLARQICAGLASNALQNAMLGVLGLAIFRLFLKRQWIVFAVATAMFAPLAARGQFQSGIAGVDLFFGVVLVAIILGVIIRFGLFAGIVGFMAHFWTFGAPLSVSASRQYFQTSLFAIGIIVALATAGFILSQGARGGRRA